MKKNVSNVVAIAVSGVLIASTVFLTAYGKASAASAAVEEQTIPKSSSQKINEEIPVGEIDVDKMFNRFSPDDQKKTGANQKKNPSQPADTKTAVKIPDDESLNVEYIKDPNYESPYYIIVYTHSSSAVVYGKDETGAYNMKIKAFTVSTGKTSTPTRQGVYAIRAKYRWRKLNGDCWGQWCSSICKDYLFHSVPYSDRRVNALYNGSYYYLGKRNSSHGCIRMCVRDVKWIYDNCPIGTQVHVVWDIGPKGASVPARKSGAKYSGWDPTDQWAPGNPYFQGVSTTESASNTTGSRVTKPSLAISPNTPRIPASTTTGSTRSTTVTKPTEAVKASTESTTSTPETSGTAPSSQKEAETPVL